IMLAQARNARAELGAEYDASGDRIAMGRLYRSPVKSRAAYRSRGPTIEACRRRGERRAAVLEERSFCRCPQCGDPGEESTNSARPALTSNKARWLATSGPAKCEGKRDFRDTRGGCSRARKFALSLRRARDAAGGCAPAAGAA